MGCSCRSGGNRYKCINGFVESSPWNSLTSCRAVHSRMDARGVESYSRVSPREGSLDSRGGSRRGTSVNPGKREGGLAVIRASLPNWITGDSGVLLIKACRAFPVGRTFPRSSGLPDFCRVASPAAAVLWRANDSYY